jgi:uncharacterized membrane protein
MKNNRTRRTVLTALFAALIFLGIFIIKIPIAATGGYIHFGDGFIYIASSILPLPFAAAAAAVGGALADMLAGYIAYAPWTAVIKALMGIVGALMLGNNRFLRRISGVETESGAHSGGAGMAVLATVIAGIINIAGYFVVECFMYSVPAAFAGVPMNCLQSAFGVAIFFILAPAFSRALHVLRQ